MEDAPDLPLQPGWPFWRRLLAIQTSDSFETDQIRVSAQIWKILRNLLLHEVSFLSLGLLPRFSHILWLVRGRHL